MKKATNKAIKSQSSNEYEDLEKELDDLDARVSNDQGLNDLFAGDEYKNEEPRGNIQDLNAAFLQDEAPPLQLQLDPQEETSQKMPPKKETVAPMIQVKKRAPVLHISSSTLPNAAAAAAATSIVKISNQAPAPASTDNDTDAQHLAPTIVKKDAKVIKSRSKPMAVPIPNSSSQPAQLDAPFPSKVKATRKPPTVTAFSLFAKSKRSSVKATLSKDDQQSIKVVNQALKDAWDEAGDEVKSAFEVIAALEGGLEPLEKETKNLEEADEEVEVEEADLGDGGGMLHKESSRNKKKSKSHKKKFREAAAEGENDGGGEGQEGELMGEEEGGSKKKAKSSKRRKSSSDHDSKKKRAKRSKRKEGEINEDRDQEGSKKHKGQEEEDDEEQMDEQDEQRWAWNARVHADVILAKTLDSTSFVVSGHCGNYGSAAEEEPQLEFPRTGLVDSRPIKMQRHAGPDPSLPVTLSILDEYEAWEERFKAEVKARSDDRGGLDLEDLPQGSLLEMCHLLYQLREEGMPLCASNRGRGNQDLMIKIPAMALSMIVQRIVDVERAKVAAAAATAAGAPIPDAPDAE